MPLTLDTVVRPVADVLWRDLEGEAVLVDLRSGTYFGLDPVGTRIWASLEKGVALREALRAVLEAFEVPEERAREDLLALAERLVAKRLLEVAPGGA